MLNQIVLMGRLTRDPELRHTQAGIPVASFSIAVDRDWSSRESGEKQTDFIDIVAWRGTAEFVSKYFSKGKMAVVSGRLQIRDWVDKEGAKRRNAEVVAENVYFGESKRSDQAQGTQYSGGAYQPSGGYQSNSYQSGGYQSGGGNYSGGYSDYNAPAIEADFTELDDDGELPF